MAANLKIESLSETICALSSGKDKAAIAVIRLSGPKSIHVLDRLSKKELNLQPRLATKLKIYSSDGAILDEVVATYFKGPASYTGEDVLEICCHGNPVIVARILDEIVSHETRLAGPGEFTQRAIVNGKMSVSEAESLNWVLNSRSKRGIELGLRAKLGGVGIQVKELAAELVTILSVVESQLDFPEHEVGQVDVQGLKESLSKVLLDLESWAQSFKKHKNLLDKYSVAIVGPPNSGKSSLFNKLLGLEKAIVFDQPGTTRDTLEQILTIEGNELFLVDTAGIRETENPIEQLGISKSREVISQANLVCWVSEEAEMPPKAILDRFSDKDWVFVASKADLQSSNKKNDAFIYTSSVSSEGIEELKAKVFGQMDGFSELMSPLTSERQAQHIVKAASFIEEAIKRLDTDEYLEWIAEALREASKNLELVVGEIPSELVLRKILSQFCIGK